MQLPGILDYHDKNLLPKDGALEYLYPYLTSEEANLYFKELLELIEWQQDEMIIYDKVNPLPRLIAWYDDSQDSRPWPHKLIELKIKLQASTGLTFNTVLLNLYRNERDHVSWHSDKSNHPSDIKNIVSLSLGETRKFQVKHKYDKNLAPLSIDLMPGSLVIMKDMQRHWLHRIALTKKPKGARINLTFRNITKRESSY